MNGLITACLDSKDVSHLLEVPTFLLKANEQAYVDFILGYRKKHHMVPTLVRFLKAFPHFVPIINDEHAPLTDIRELFVEQRKEEFIVAKCSEIAAAIREGEIHVDDAMNALSEIIRNVRMSGASLSCLTTFDRNHYFRTGKAMKTGLKIIDRVTRGIFAGEVMLLAARLGVGKSTALFFIVAGWLMEGKRILFVSKEMPAADVLARVDAIIGGFNPLLLRDEGAKETMMGELDNVVKREIASGGELIIPNGFMFTPANIEALAKNLDVDVVVIDGVYLLSPSNAPARGASGWENTASVSREVKAAALSTMVPFLTTTQLKRVGAKEDYDPEDIAYSDALGQDADFVLTLKAMAKSEGGLPRTEMSLIKNRYGANAGCLVETDFSTMTRRELLAPEDEI